MQCVLDPTWSDERLMPGAAAQLMTLSSVIQRDIYRPTGQSCPDPRTSLASLRSITQAQALVTPLRSILLSGPERPPTPRKKSETGCREAQARHRAACGTYIVDLARPAALGVARLVRRGSRRQRR